MTLKRVLEPISIGPLEIKNRIARTAHGENLGPHYMSAESVAYHLARARGGCGLTILGGIAVHPSTIGYGALSDDAAISRIQGLMRAVAPYRMRVVQQLFHGGHHYADSSGGPPWAVSTVPSPSPFSTRALVGIPMTRDDIHTLVAAFAETAARCREGGLQGVEINAAHGYLVQQFLSPSTNTRDDEYGGSLDNRMRFVIEVYTAIRAAVGNEMIIGCRIGSTERSSGPDLEELNHVALTLERLGVDYFASGLGDYGRLERMVGAMQLPSGYQAPSARSILRGVRCPKIIAGRFRTLEEAEQILREGDFDLVGMVRALIADPDLVRKTLEEGAERVRPCIACNQGCVGGLLRGEGMHCTVNPTAGYELQFPDAMEPVATPRRVVVVGGGPAGLEAARTAAVRGHAVVLFEASPKLGGMITVAMRAAQQSSLGDIAGWLESEIYRLGVDVRLGTYIEAEDILALQPDAVIVATGSTPRMDGWQSAEPDRPISGVDRSHVISSVDLLTAPPQGLGQTAVVLDTVGHFEGVVCAVQLIKLGIAVTYVTSHRAFAPYVHTTDRDESLLEMLNAGEFTLLINHVLVDIQPGSCTVQPVNSRHARRLTADTVVLVTPNAPNRELFDALRGRVPALTLAGDALSPRDIQMAILDGHRQARALS